MAVAVPPASRICLTCASASSVFPAKFTTTANRSPASRFAMAAPMPRDAPVTIAVFPFCAIGSSSPLRVNSGTKIALYSISMNHEIGKRVVLLHDRGGRDELVGERPDRAVEKLPYCFVLLTLPLEALLSEIEHLVLLHVGVVLVQRLSKSVRPVIPADEVQVIDIGGGERRRQRGSTWRSNRSRRESGILVGVVRRVE